MHARHVRTSVRVQSENGLASFDIMTEGVVQHVDRDYDIYDFPDELRGGLLYRPLHRMRPGTSVRIQLNATCSVYLCFHVEEDGGYGEMIPSLAGWTEVEGVLLFDSLDPKHHGTMSIHRHRATAGSSIVIPATVERDACFNLVFVFSDSVHQYDAGSTIEPPAGTTIDAAAGSTIGPPAAAPVGECALLLEMMSAAGRLASGSGEEACGRNLLFQRHHIAFYLAERFVHSETLKLGRAHVRCCGSACPDLHRNVSLYARLVGPRILSARARPYEDRQGSLVVEWVAPEEGEYQLEVSLSWLNGDLFASEAFRARMRAVRCADSRRGWRLEEVSERLRLEGGVGRGGEERTCEAVRGSRVHSRGRQFADVERQSRSQSQLVLLATWLPDPILHSSRGHELPAQAELHERKRRRRFACA